MVSRRLVPGLYDAVVDEAMDALLGQEPAEGVFHERLERDREAAALSLARLVHDRTLATLRGLGASDAASAVDRQVTVTNALLDRLHEISAQTTLPEDRVAQPPRRLLALVPRGSKFSAGPLATVEPPARPEVPLGVSDLMVNGRHDLRLGTELVRELASADTVDLLCSFLKYSGLRVVEDALTSFFARQGRMRVLTTAYMGATERRALDEIARLGAEVRVSYDVEHTRLHAKAWLFHRESGPSTAYVGSSNLSRAAMLDGLEWNVRLSRADNATILEKFKRVFDHYWTEAGFEPYDPDRDGSRFDETVRRQAVDRSRLLLSIHVDREGVFHSAQHRADLLFVTLEKSEAEYSPTTMYRDYAISRTRFHWESQSAVHDGTKTGERYARHAQLDHAILLFVRERRKTRADITMPYTFLGPCRYVRHQAPGRWRSSGSSSGRCQRRCSKRSRSPRAERRAQDPRPALSVEVA